MRFKPKDYRDYSAYFVCWEADCQDESTKIWADKETSMIDLCDKHYEEATKERFL